ncbi:TPA: hypothetical protein LQ488_004596 [Salmonella enterica subsp. enterica serovar Derby]|uniref:Uncharacterized protein n=1 Tax=Salmonella enterica TaxID=28901 RepID=A0A753X549_SALER|nr:hypothetical protein [Salmonella enterica]EFU9111177.1 hypothetical protein [Salmonella enterica]EGJ9524714.1 hypothetical protein [Salmonella enterica subsp. enterica serovar Derby]EGJ9528770.1 hypothetical protein [Salmonella enterica subsp. enterica serovar Derby]EHW4360964.1 hypothetical protein [Salmonella enterica subsp. enterica serovar Derby]EHW4363328.1 hypothetical protein [Salmonella enterica subsp. enterica serovar Derby]
MLIAISEGTVNSRLLSVLCYRHLAIRLSRPLEPQISLHQKDGHNIFIILRIKPCTIEKIVLVGVVTKFLTQIAIQFHLIFIEANSPDAIPDNNTIQQEAPLFSPATNTAL